MIRKAKNFTLLAIGAALLSQGQIAGGAIVNFGAATEFVDSSDFDPLPHIIYAINGGNAGDSHTVNIGGTPVFFESILDTSNAITAGGDTFSGTVGELYGPELPAGHVPLATDQIALDEVLASQHYVDGEGASFSITLQNLSIGQSYRLQVIGPADSRGCCSARSHDVASAGGGTAGTVHRFADLDADTNMHVTTIIGNFTADATEQEFIFGGGIDGGGEGALLLSSDMPLQIAEPQLTIDRITGKVVLENVNALADTAIQGYSLLSTGGTFNHTAWLSISDNYDLSSGGEVDNNDNWTEAAANATELSDFNFASPGTTGTPGDAAPLAAGQEINLGNVWFRTPIEDVIAEVAFSDSTVEQIPVVYVGSAPLVGDLNSDNVINPTDWQLFKDGSNGPDFSSVTAVAAYRRGDLDRRRLLMQSGQAGTGLRTGVAASRPSPLLPEFMESSNNNYFLVMVSLFGLAVGLFSLLCNFFISSVPCAWGFLVLLFNFIAGVLVGTDLEEGERWRGSYVGVIAALVWGVSALVTGIMGFWLTIAMMFLMMLFGGMASFVGAVITRGKKVA